MHAVAAGDNIAAAVAAALVAVAWPVCLLAGCPALLLLVLDPEAPTPAVVFGSAHPAATAARKASPHTCAMTLRRYAVAGALAGAAVAVVPVAVEVAYAMHAVQHPCGFRGRYSCPHRQKLQSQQARDGQHVRGMLHLGQCSGPVLAWLVHSYAGMQTTYRLLAPAGQ